MVSSEYKMQYILLVLLVLFHISACLSSFMKRYDHVSKEESCQTSSEALLLRMMFSVLYHLEAITVNELEVIIDVIWRPYVVSSELITLLLEVLHKR